MPRVLEAFRVMSPSPAVRLMIWARILESGPRHWPAGTPGGKGGEFMPNDAGGIREVLTVGSRQGSADMAEKFVSALFGPDAEFSGPEMFGFEHVGSGSQREVWVDDTGTVYKFGLDSANRQEARTMKRLRAEGADYAPDVTLYEVEVDIAEPYEEPRKETKTVIAMPYLPEDGSVEHAGLVLPGAGDFNPENVVSHGGKLWLVDAGGM